MRTISEIMSEDREKMKDILSPLASGWETILFRAIDVLYNLRKEGYLTEDIASQLRPMVVSGKMSESDLNLAIQKVQKEMSVYSDDKFMRAKFREVLDLLFSVKISEKQKD